MLEWGSTFRVSYLNLKRMRSQALDVKQIVMLTGSAPPILRRSLISTMRLREPAIFVRSHNRENLFLEVTSKKGIDKDVLLIIKMCNEMYPGRSGIVYCRTRKDCETVAEKLKSKGKTNIAVFTGDLSVKQKTEVLENWLSEEV